MRKATVTVADNFGHQYHARVDWDGTEEGKAQACRLAYAEAEAYEDSQLKGGLFVTRAEWPETDNMVIEMDVETLDALMNCDIIEIIDAGGNSLLLGQAIMVGLREVRAVASSGLVFTIDQPRYGRWVLTPEIPEM